MSFPIVLPDLCSGEDEIRVSSWFVEPGETIEEGDRVVEVLIPGMTFDVVSPATGILERIEQPVDAVVKSGEILGWIQPIDDRLTPE